MVVQKIWEYFERIFFFPLKKISDGVIKFAKLQNIS